MGTGATERIGTKVNLESYNIHMNMRFPDEPSPTTLSSSFNNFIRYGVFYDRAPNGASLPSLEGDVFEAFWGHLNKNNRDRFFIISDKYAVLGDFANFQRYVVDPGPPPVFSNPTFFWTNPRYLIWKEYKDVDLSVTYDIADDTGVDPNSGMLWAFVLRGKNADPGHLLADWDMRTTFTDAI